MISINAGDPAQPDNSTGAGIQRMRPPDCSVYTEKGRFMHKASLIGCVAAITVAITLGAMGAAVAQPSGYNYGPGWMGPGMMYGGGPGSGYGPGWMGPGMMYGGGPGSGYGPGWMGPGMMYGYGYGRGGWGPQQQGNLNLTVAQVKTNMERWLASEGNPHLKLGTVVAKDDSTITADVVTTDKDALVERYEINRHTGYMQPMN